jgi:hypothetical protein
MVRAFGAPTGTPCGYYDLKRRYEGDEFMVEEKDFSKTWMEKVEPGEKKKVAAQPSKPAAKAAKSI